VPIPTDYIHILHTFMLYRTFKTVKDEVQKEYLLKICNLISKKKKNLAGGGLKQ